MDLFSKFRKAKPAPSSPARMSKPSNEMTDVIANSLPGGRQAMEFLNRWGKEPDISKSALARKYWGWVYACANLSATRFASTPLKLYASRSVGESRVKNFRAHPVPRHKSFEIRNRIGKAIPRVSGASEYEELEEHPLLDLLAHINEEENSFEAKELTQVMLDLTGDAYWYVEPDRFGLPIRIFVMRSQWTKIIPDREKFVSGYIYGSDNGSPDRLQIPPERVIHFKYPNPYDPWYGLGPVEAAAYAIESQELREKFIIATMGNMARPDLIIKYLDGELDSRDRASTEREWNSMYQGVKNVGKVKVTDFRWEVEKVGWNPRELDFNSGEEWLLKKICAAFPVPEGLIDTSNISKAPASGLSGSDLSMAQFNTLPRCTRFEQKLNEKLCSKYDGRLFFAFEDIVPKDRAIQMNEDNIQLTNGSRFINELRERDGLPPVAWGDQPLVLSSAPSPLPGQPGSEDNPADPKKDQSGEDKNGTSSPVEDLIDDEEEDLPEPPKKKPRKAFKGVDGMTMEVEGAFVHPDLEGIPVKLVKVKPVTRNEGGQFDRLAPDRLHADPSMSPEDRRSLITSLRPNGGN